MKCVIDKSSLITKIVALKWLIYVVLNWIEKFNGSRFIHFKHNDRQIISINVNIIWRSISRCIQDAFTIHIYIN